MDDNQKIEALGGAAVLSKKLGMKYQRVFNWKSRGIPAAVKLQYPDLFLNHIIKKEKKIDGKEKSS